MQQHSYYLLEGDIPTETLKRFAVEPSVKSQIRGWELYYAAHFAHTVKTLEKDAAIRQIYAEISRPNIRNTVAEVSGASALQYLCPEVLQTESGADVASDAGIYLNFSERQKKNEVGQGVRGNNSYAVNGLPSLDELRAGKKFDEFDIQEKKKGDPTLRKITYVLSNVTSIKIDATGNVRIPKREGRPSEGFFRFYAETIDRDKNGVDDGVLVYYGSNKIQREDGAILSKVDTYDGRGGFVESGLVWFLANETGEDIPAPEQLAKKWNLEFKPSLYKRQP